MSNKAKRASTLADLQKSRTLLADGPSGMTYKIRPMSMERYALAGGLPAQLRQIAMEGAEGINKVLGGSSEEIAERGKELTDYMDGLVRQIVVEPDLAEADLDDLPPVDYKWLVNIALGEEDRDGEGRRLWGREPLTTWGMFREVHGCTEDCESCARLRLAVADLQ